MSRFHGAQGEGAQARAKAIRRAEAEERNARTPEHRKAAARPHDKPPK